MKDLRTLIAKILVVVLAQAAMPADSATLWANDTQPAYTEKRIHQFGEGAELKLTLADGHKMRGHIESLGQESFRFADRSSGETKEIAYSDVDKVRYPHRSYTAVDETDPVAARAMVLTLGVGEHIMVKVGENKKLHGNILEISEDDFVIQPDNQVDPVRVPYTSVRKVHKNLSFGATLAIVVGIAAAVVLILVLTGEDEIDVLPN